MRTPAALLTALLCAPAAIGQLNVSGNFPVSTLDTAPASQSITALNGAVQLALAGQAGAGVTLSGSWTATVTPEISFDGGTTWTATFFKIPATAQFVTTVAANGAYALVCATGASHVRVRASAFTSGTITVALRAGQAREVPALFAGPVGSAVPPVSALVGGSDGANLRALTTDTSGRLGLAGSSGANITTATTTAVKATAGILRRIVVGTGVASATVKLFNVASASCSGTPGSGAAGVITLPSTLANPFTLEFNQTYSAGICVVTSGATNLIVIFDQPMQPTFLGKITVASAGTPVPLSTDATIRACTILVATIPGLTGNVYFGGAALNQSTLAGVMIKFNAPAVLGQPDHFILQTQDGRNSLRVSDYFIDASVSGEGALVTYFQT